MTDENGGKMNIPSDSEEILKISRVVAESLKMFNDVFFQQQQSIAALASGISHETINLVREVNKITEDKSMTGEEVKKIEKKYKEKIDSIMKAKSNNESKLQKFLDSTTKNQPYSHYKSAAVHALSNACHNAVAAQQQSNTITQAVIDQGISTMYSLMGASLGIVEKKKTDNM